MALTQTITHVQPIVRNVSVLRGKYTSSNGGVSDQYDSVTVYPQGTSPSEVERVTDAVTLEYGNLAGTVIAVPLNQPEHPRVVGPMASGAYIATSDSRFREAVEKMLGHRFYGAIPLHDRFETWAQYDALSR